MLVGDHKQLPPIVTSAEALAGGLNVSLFERLVEEGGVCFHRYLIAFSY